MGAGPESAPAPRKNLCIDYSAPANQREAWTRVGWTGVSWIRVLRWTKQELKVVNPDPGQDKSVPKSFQTHLTHI